MQKRKGPLIYDDGFYGHEPSNRLARIAQRALDELRGGPLTMSSLEEIIGDHVVRDAVWWLIAQGDVHLDADLKVALGAGSRWNTGQIR